MSTRDIGQEILDGLREIKRYNAGQGKLKSYALKLPDDVKAIRDRMRLSQQSFAALMGVSLRTLQEWEQGRRKPTGPALSLLRVAERHPKALLG